MSKLLSLCQGVMGLAEVTGDTDCVDNTHCGCHMLEHPGGPHVPCCIRIPETDIRFHAYLATDPVRMAEYLRLKGEQTDD